MHHFFLSLLIFLLLDETSYSAAAASGGGDLCSRRCGGATVPYPFGFSPGCPIPLSCDTSTSTPILQGENGTMYSVIAFNSTTSTVVVGLPPSCSRSVSEARMELSRGNYDVSSRTSLFLHGGCSGINASLAAGCSMPVDVLSGLLRTARCVGNDTAVACVASAVPNSTVHDQFLRWEKVEKQKCDDVLTSSVFVFTAKGTPTLEFGVAELGWWLNGTCGAGKGARCAANATCTDVQTPSGEMGHRCACVVGMAGDGFMAGDGCYLAAAGSCNHWCGGTNVPYPFSFTDGCPIALSCDANTSKPILPYTDDDDNGSSPYHVVSFNSTVSSLVVSLPPSCTRSVSDVRKALSSRNYDVSLRTILLLRGGCRGRGSHAAAAPGCGVPASAVSRLLRTAQCGTCAERHRGEGGVSLLGEGGGAKV